MPVLGCQFVLAAGFVTPALFFAGLALAAIPVIIHILNRRRFRTVPWAAMDFLLRAMRKNRRRLRFEQWILLATRCLLLALLGAALARPLSCDRSSIASLAGQRNALHVIVIDNSYSMAYEADRPDAKTHLDQARRIARGLIDRLSSGGESVAIVLAGQPASAVVDPPTYDLDAARSAIDLIEQSQGGTDLIGALRLALDIGSAESRQPRKFLHVITDATRSAWLTSDAQGLRQLGTDLAAQFAIAHYNLGRSAQANRAILSLRPQENLVTSRFNSQFIASARHFGNDAAPAGVQWKLDGRIVGGGGGGGAMRATAEPQDIVLSQLNFKNGGPHLITAQIIDDDRLPIDNVRSRVVEVTSKLNVLIVEGDRGLGPLAGSAAFLQLALAPPREAGGANTAGGATDSYVNPEVISDLELSNKVLSDYRAVILTNVAQLLPAQADQLGHFVANGGTLLIFMGGQVNAGNYNSVLLPRGLLPGQLTQLMSAPSDSTGFHFDFQPHGVLHPLLRIFYGEENSGVDTAQIEKYWQIDLPTGGNAERVLNYAGTSPNSAATEPSSSAMQNEDPAITLHPLGGGRVVVVTTSANAEWTTFPAKPAYVPLVHEILSGSIEGEDAWMNRVVGQPLEIPQRIKLTAAPQLLDPQQSPVALEQAIGADGRATYRSKPLARPGVYTLNTGQRSIPIAVNVPADDEADVQTLDDAAIRSALGDIEIQLESDQLPAVDESDVAGNDLGWSFLIAVLALAAAECTMAMTFGHYKRSNG